MNQYDKINFTSFQFEIHDSIASTANMSIYPTANLILSSSACTSIRKQKKKTFKSQNDKFANWFWRKLYTNSLTMTVKIQQFEPKLLKYS